jgi:hypothetical protein
VRCVGAALTPGTGHDGPHAQGQVLAVRGEVDAPPLSSDDLKTHWEVDLGPGPRDSAGDSGIEGLVLAAPAGPQAPAGASPSSTAGPGGPVRVEVRAMGTKLQQGNLVTAVETDPAGRFRIPLPPGQYVVSVVAPGRPVSSPGVPVTVQAHQYATVTLQIDIGLR